MLLCKETLSGKTETTYSMVRRKEGKIRLRNRANHLFEKNSNLRAYVLLFELIRIKASVLICLEDSQHFYSKEITIKK